MSLRFRINLLITCLMLAFMMVLAAIVVNNFRSSIREEVEAAAKVTAQALKTAVNDRLRQGAGDEPNGSIALLGFLKSLGHVRSNDLFVQDAAGALTYVSPPATYKAGRFAPEWFAALVNPRLPIVEIKLERMTLRIVPDPSRATLDAWDDLTGLFWLALVFFAAINGVVFWFVGKALQPVNAIVEALNHMQQGRFYARLPVFSLPELDSIRHTFNRMAETLDRSLSENRRLERDRQLANVIRRRLEEERKTIARELHDELGQCITAIKTISVSISNRARESFPEIHGSARTIATVAERMYDAVHDIVYRLRSGDARREETANLLRELVDAWRTHHADTEVVLRLDGELGGLGEATGITAFRIVQECLNNVAKHARARRVEIALCRTPVAPEARAPLQGGALKIMVRDDGVGMPPRNALASRRFGLTGIRERVQALGGELRIESCPGRGACVNVVLPAKEVDRTAALSWQFMS